MVMIVFVSGHLETLFPVLMMVICSEMFVDWVKHAFITKFNDIQTEVSYHLHHYYYYYYTTTTTTTTVTIATTVSTMYCRCTRGIAPY